MDRHPNPSHLATPRGSVYCHSIKLNFTDFYDKKHGEKIEHWLQLDIESFITTANGSFSLRAICHKRWEGVRVTVSTGRQN